MRIRPHRRTDDWRPFETQDLREHKVKIEADIRELVDGLERGRAVADRMLHRVRLRHERIAARAWFDEYATDAWARYGWARPDDLYRGPGLHTAVECPDPARCGPHPTNIVTVHGDRRPA